MSKIALLPGGFKPPHIGHYDMALKFLKDSEADKLIIFVGPKERDGVTQAMSFNLWKIYTQKDSKLEIRQAGVSPVRDVYDFIEQEAPEESTVYLGMGEKDSSDKRYANIGKFAEPRNITFEIKLIKPQGGGISGTDMRGFIQSDDKELFKKGLPNNLSDKQKEQAWNIVIGNIEEDLYNPEDKVLDYMRGSEWKAGMPDGHKDDIRPAYKYNRGGTYTHGGMYESLEGDKASKIFVMKSPHTPKGQKWDHIGFILNDGRLRDMSGHRGSDKAPETYKYEDTEELFQMPKDKNEAIKKGLYAEKPLPKEITIPNTIACDIKTKNKAENCGSFVKIVLSNNGIETTKSNWMGDIYNSLNEDHQTGPQGKILHVYDFDDTITQVKANIGVTITSPNGDYNREILIPAANFPEESKELEARLGNLNIEYDFSEFEKQIGDAIINSKVVNKLKSSLSKPDIKTTILTARTIGHPVTKYLKDKLGLAAYVVPLGLQVSGDRVTGQDKADWIENHINKGYNTIYFIDDSEENRTAVAALQDKYPDTKITVENPHEVSEMMGMMNKQEKAKHAKNMKRLSKDMSNMKGNNYGGGGYKVPDYVKGTLTRKLHEEMSHSDLNSIETYADEKLNPVDIVLTDKHFFNRLNDPRNKEEISSEELIGFFERLSNNKKSFIDFLTTYKELVVHDNRTNINIPFMKLANKAIAKTIMRKKNFNTSNPKISINEFNDYDVKQWATHADLYKKLSTPDAEETYSRLKNKLKMLMKIDPENIISHSQRLEALEYFYDYFKEDPTRTLETKYGGHDMLSQYKDQIKDPQEYRDLQLMLSQNKDKEVIDILKAKNYMNETKLFSQNWWSNIINEHIITEGGAAGHMAHPFNLSFVNSGKDLKDIFEKSATSLQKNPGAVKIDGVNASIRLVDIDGKKQFALDRGSKKALDIKGVTKSDLEDRFKTKDGTPHGFIKTGGDVLDMFNEALPSLKSDLEKLGAWEDPNILFNMEYVSGKTNVQKYKSNFIAIHGLNRIEMVDEPSAKTGKILSQRKSKEIHYDTNSLQSLLNNLAPTAKKRGFEVHGTVETEMKKKPNFGSALSKSYTIKSNEGDKTQSLDSWLNELNDIPEEDFIFMSGKKVGAVSKAVYIALLQGENIDELFEDEDDKKKAIEGFTTYLATEKLGDEVLKVLDSPMGSVENHEGVVIRDKSISDVTFKITGKFILGGMATGFR